MRIALVRQLDRWPLLVGLAVLIVLVAYPAALLIVQSIFPEALAGDFSGPFGAYRRILTTDGVPGMLWNSVRWAGATTALAWLMGVPCGYVLARTNLRGKVIARLLFLVPIMTPPYVFALSYTLLMLPGGFGDSMLGGVPEWLRSLFFSFWGVTFVMAISSFGYITLAVETALRATPIRLEHAAAMLGASRMDQFRLVLLPLLRPALLNAGLLVFLDAISNFGVPAIMGPRANLPLLPAEIYALITSWPVDFPLATALSSLLLFVAILTLLINQRLLRRSQQFSGRSPQTQEYALSPLGHVLIWLGFILVFLLTVLLPYLAMLLSSVVDRWAAGTPELTWRHYRELLTPGSRGLGALWTSLWLSLAAATICAALGGFIAYAIARFRGPLATLLDLTATLPRVLPKIVMAVALIMAWNAPWVGDLRLYNTIWMLLVAYIALYLSDALRYGDAGMRQISPRLEHAAESLGASRARSFGRITLPLLWPSLLAGWLTTFIACMRDLVASVILLPPGVETVGSFIFNQFEQGEIAAAMAMATLVMILTTTVLLFVQRSARGGTRR